MTEERGKDLKDRTKKFALRIIQLFTALPERTQAQIIGKQILRSGHHPEFSIEKYES